MSGDNAIAPIHKGLAGVVVAETQLSFPDTRNKRLLIRGTDLRTLVEKPDFIGATHFLWGDLVEEDTDERTIGLLRQKAHEKLAPLFGAVEGLPPVDGMRTLVSALPDHSVTPAMVLAATGVAAAVATRTSMGAKPAQPDVSASHACDLLRLIVGETPPPAHQRAFETYLVAMMEHSLNASTFTARVVASTQAGLVAAVTASLAALRGPLHGGAPSLVLDILDEASATNDLAAYAANRVASGRRLFGFGSRGYAGRDPRTDIFKAALRLVAGEGERFAIAERFEAAALETLRQMKPGHPIETNVEFYGALLLEAIGIPRSGFTAVFAASRCAGWIAHVREEERAGRLMRPEARYVGPWPSSGPVLEITA